MSDGFGLDKAARLNAKREAQEVEEVPEPLEPPFPYRAEPFDPEFFNMPADPDPELDQPR